MNGNNAHRFARIGICLSSCIGMFVMSAGLFGESIPSPLATPEIEIQQENEGGQVTFSPDGGEILAATWYNPIKLWDSSTGGLLRTFGNKIDATAPIVFSPDGRTFVSGSGELSSTIWLWDLVSAKVNETFSKSDLFCFAFSPDGNILASAYGGKARLWDVASGELINELSGHTDLIYALAFSQDGRSLLSASNDNTIRIWDVNGKRSLKVFSGPSDGTSKLCFSPDGRSFYSVSGDQAIRLWSVDKGVEKVVDISSTSRLYTVAFSTDLMYAASGYENGTLTLWDLNRRTKLATINGHKEGIYSLAFSPDGRRIVSLSSDGTIKVWDVGKLLR